MSSGVIDLLSISTCIYSRFSPLHSHNLLLLLLLLFLVLLAPSQAHRRMLMTAVHMDSTSTATTPPHAPSSHHHSLPRAAPAARRVAKRRPRPSRRLPTTYISVDPASFCRMVQQVTGADDLPALPQPNNAELLLTCPAPVRAAAGGGGSTGPGGALVNMLLPTLDTSAFLVHALSRVGTDAPSCEGSARSAASAASAPALEVEVEAGGACCNNSGGGFLTMESWDHALF